VVVAVNTFASDTEAEIECIRDKCEHLGVEIVAASHHANGGAGAEDLARAVVQVAENTHSDFKPLYPDDMKLWDKARTVAQEIYGANDIMGDKLLRGKFRRLEEEGYGHLPVCMAKTQYSLSTDPGLKGRPHGFDVPIRDVKVSAGAGFAVVLTGDIMTMPGLPKKPSAESIDFDAEGQITGLF
jgi:formate--tetrahydrofolate ligase